MPSASISSSFFESFFVSSPSSSSFSDSSSSSPSNSSSNSSMNIRQISSNQVIDYDLRTVIFEKRSDRKKELFSKTSKQIVESRSPIDSDIFPNKLSFDLPSSLSTYSFNPFTIDSFYSALQSLNPSLYDNSNKDSSVIPPSNQSSSAKVFEKKENSFPGYSRIVQLLQIIEENSSTKCEESSSKHVKTYETDEDEYGLLQAESDSEEDEYTEKSETSSSTMKENVIHNTRYKRRKENEDCSEEKGKNETDDLDDDEEKKNEEYEDDIVFIGSNEQIEIGTQKKLEQKVKETRNTQEKINMDWFIRMKSGFHGYISKVFFKQTEYFKEKLEALYSSFLFDCHQSYL
ncbi:uncharacterized protein MONOS_11155 [Monocercomonoides exilis]|uniref:uncharacterized protein n=1 Tax=Monocercomonoides exilis TaxID=2049356 RepID=UPI00355AB8DF|nr:hypothetical protein MONOS_11155 [Monocercomonoides exilis]|eukprot:MONOS_11155.1-p1 / transcript=MONOS_11155.1 / gene=MONOS_11155 / organism=Monocercomonoides_exilis_PA203 / gene_product=unspecified product / transcript_product=unspecified product / location=Mono_scaffold00545:12913-13950(+) / protein_length=346 / sequence_SO=supercontig / SO=protein_coding / is_pseudo=false